MTEQAKPREFWITYDEHLPSTVMLVEPSAYDATEYVHVIEASALDELKRELDCVTATRDYFQSDNQRLRELLVQSRDLYGKNPSESIARFEGWRLRVEQALKQSAGE